MKKIFLKLKDDNPAKFERGIKTGYLPVDAENINPDIFRESNKENIGALKLYCGNTEYLIRDFFEIEGEYGEDIIIEGDLFNFKEIGKKMSGGSIYISGNTGMHTGNYMSGGIIKIEGNCGDWLGTEMTGGLIRVSGDAGNYVGAAYRGDKLGMNRGVIIIEGNAGDFVGNQMRRGEIIILGNTGIFPGAQMIAGSLYVFGQAGLRAGAGMKRGTIITFSSLKILPTFKYNITYKPHFLQVAFNLLKEKYNITIDKEKLNGNYHRYSGDNTEIGKGEIFVWAG